MTDPKTARAGEPGAIDSPRSLERYLHRHIPLSRDMAVSVVSIEDDTVTLGAPLPPNINHRKTVFGGSASALAMLAAWSLLHVRLGGVDNPSRLVIQRNTMEFTQPITAAFTARSVLAQAGQWPQFIRTLERRGKGRVTAVVELEQDGQLVGTFRGEFVALKKGCD
jgi:thioesterase domain-containing protein